MKFLILLTTFFLSIGCAHGPRLRAIHYQVDLKEVSRQNKKVPGLTKKAFEDDAVKISWVAYEERVSFRLTNKTDQSMQIVWDEAAYVDTDGVSHHVIHKGIKYANKESPQPPTIVPAKQMVEDIVSPSDHIFIGYSSWIERPILPTKLSDYYVLRKDISDEGNKAIAESHRGKTILILLPLKIQNVVTEYSFTFEIADISFVYR